MSKRKLPKIGSKKAEEFCEDWDAGTHLEKLKLCLEYDVDYQQGKSFRSACNRAGLNDFTFHDLRHCAINNLRLAGNDYFRIMTVSAYKTMSVFKRYNNVLEDELNEVVWPRKETV